MKEYTQKIKPLARTIQGSGSNQKVGFVDNRTTAIIQKKLLNRFSANVSQFDAYWSVNADKIQNEDPTIGPTTEAYFKRVGTIKNKMFNSSEDAKAAARSVALERSTKTYLPYSVSSGELPKLIKEEERSLVSGTDDPPLRAKIKLPTMKDILMGYGASGTHYYYLNSVALGGSYIPVVINHDKDPACILENEKGIKYYSVNHWHAGTVSYTLDNIKRIISGKQLTYHTEGTTEHYLVKPSLLSTKK